jgi:molecular chaperone GrpE
MARGNGKPEVDPAELDVDHELPAAQDDPPAAAEQRQELEQLRRERDELYDRLARLQAEFDNARKRAAREQADFRVYAVADALKSLLPIGDSFERALQAPAESGDFRGGVELIYRQLQDVFSRLGVTVLRPQPGEAFDPRQHEAVEMAPTSEGEDNRILEVLQPGYRLKDRLLRPAMVRVAKRI